MKYQVSIMRNHNLRSIFMLLTMFMSSIVMAQTAQTSKDDLKDTANQTLADGTVYIVNSNMTINSDKSSLNGLKVAEGATTTLFIPAGVKLTVYGKDASGTTGGGAGILVPATSTLYITGAGTLNVYGGNAADGGKGEDGGAGKYNSTSSYVSGNGGKGGNGGGGAGAAIGGNGGAGGAGGNGGGSVNQTKNNGLPNTDIPSDNKFYGKGGSNGSTMGNVFVMGTVTVNAELGKAGAGGSGGSEGEMDSYTGSIVIYQWNYIAGGGGGGAGGGGGYIPEYAIGGGASGAGGGSGGGSGGTDQQSGFFSYINSRDKKCAGGPATGVGLGAVNGEPATGERDQGASSGTQFATQGGFGCAVGGSAGENGGNGTLTFKTTATLNDSKNRKADNTIAEVLDVPNALKVMITLENHGGDIANETFEWRIGEKMPAKTMPKREGYIFVGYFTEQNGGGTQIYHYDGTVNYLCDFANSSQTQTLHAHYVPASHKVTWNYTYIDPVDGQKKILTNGDRSNTATVNINLSDGTVKTVNVNAGALVEGQESAEVTVILGVASAESLNAPNVKLTEADMAKVVSFDVTISPDDKDRGYKVTKASAAASEIFYTQGAFTLPWVITPTNTISKAFWPSAVYVKVLTGANASSATNPIVEHASMSVRCELDNGSYRGSYPVRKDIVESNGKAYYRIQIVSVDNNGKESHFETYIPTLISAEGDAKSYINDETDYTINYNLTIPMVKLDPNGGELTTTTPQYAWESSISLSDNYGAVREGCDFLGWSTTKYEVSKEPSHEYTDEYPIVGGDAVLYAVWKDVQAPMMTFSDYDESNAQLPYSVNDNMSGVKAVGIYFSTTLVSDPSTIASWGAQGASPIIVPSTFEETSKVFLYVKTEDNAGNVDYQMKEIEIDPEAPTITTDPLITDRIEGTDIWVACQKKDAQQVIIPLSIPLTIADNVNLKTVTVLRKKTDAGHYSLDGAEDITTKLSGGKKEKTLNLEPPSPVGTKAECHLYDITAIDNVGNETHQQIAVFNKHVWGERWEDEEPTANAPGMISHKKCSNCHVVVIVQATKKEIDTSDPAQKAQVQIPAKSVLLKGYVQLDDETEPNFHIVGFDGYVNTAIASAISNTNATTVKLTGPSMLDAYDKGGNFTYIDDETATSIGKKIELDLNGQSIQKKNGDAIDITGHNNVTILLTDNGELPYTNKSSVSAASPVKYVRTFSSVQGGNWQALYVPFKLNDDGLDGATVCDIKLAKTAGGNTTLETVEKSSGFAANNWYLVKHGEGVMTMTGNTLAAKAITEKSLGEGYTISGSLENSDHVASVDKDFWVVTNGGKFAWAKAGSHQRPYRWVVTGPAAQSANAINIVVVDGDVTGIETVKETVGSADIYTIDGRKVQGSADRLPRGLYIRNGKKFVVR